MNIFARRALLMRGRDAALRFGSCTAPMASYLSVPLALRCAFQQIYALEQGILPVFPLDADDGFLTSPLFLDAGRVEEAGLRPVFVGYAVERDHDVADRAPWVHAMAEDVHGGVYQNPSRIRRAGKPRRSSVVEHEAPLVSVVPHAERQGIRRKPLRHHVRRARVAHLLDDGPGILVCIGAAEDLGVRERLRMRPIGLDVVHRDRLDAPGMVDEDFRIHAEDVVEPVPIGVERELAHSVYPQVVQASRGSGAHAPEVGDGGVVPERRTITPFVEDAEEIGAVLRRYVERDLGEEGLKRSVVVVATSDQPALVRIKGAMTGTAIAEYFRDQGHKVVLMMDSVTRFAMAQREVGLTIGEPPATRGYTPSVFAMLPRLLERAGTSEKGSITGIYTVLVDGDDMNEPIADAVRSILDGHIVLSRRIAAQNHFPAIDVLGSVSRVMYEVVDKSHLAAAQEMRQLMAVYAEAEDLIHIGAYVKGSSPKIDAAIQKIDGINAFLCQDIYEVTSYEETEKRLLAAVGKTAEPTAPAAEPADAEAAS